MGISDRVQGTFESLPPFTSALQQGVNEELAPLKNQIAELQGRVAALESQVQNLQNTLSSFSL